MKRVFSIIIVLCFVFNSIFIVKAEDNNPVTEVTVDAVPSSYEEISYYDYQKNLAFSPTENSIDVGIAETDTLKDGGIYEYKFNAAFSGRYGLFLTYNASEKA